MFYNISHKPQKEYIITKSGEHVFYFENISGTINFIINAKNSTLRIYGLYTAKNNEKFTLDITQIHNAQNSHSKTLIKSVLDGSSQLYLTGKIHINNNARNSTAFLTNKNLLISQKAHIISIPQLEILPHEVKCTHAAVTTPLDTEQLNYLISRGISESHAQQLLIDGFTQEILRHKKNS